MVCRVAVIGAGTVGGGVVDILTARGAELASRTGGVPLELAVVCDVSEKALASLKKAGLAGSVETTGDARGVLARDDIDVVVELIGGTTDAKEIATTALRAGKAVVTANKALLAERGTELFKLARKKGLSIGFEASVCGGIPLLRSIRTGLATDRISAFKGIVNGTSNFILSRMYRDASSYNAALRLAQEEGYAEADPTLDVTGMDSAHKLVLFSGVAFGMLPTLDDIIVKGIDGLENLDIAHGRELGYVTKLIAAGRRREDDVLELSVYPTLLPASHPLAAVSGTYNAVWVESDAVGTSMYYGPGAGMLPTANAVVSDILDIVTGSAQGEYNRLRFVDAPPAQVLPSTSTDSRRYLRFTAKDEFGVLGRIASILGNHQVSIASVVQKASNDPLHVPIVILTHTAREENVTAALRKIDEEPFVTAATAALRIDDEENLL